MIYIMAISIKTIPVLLGETADRFVREAERNSANSRSQADYERPSVGVQEKRGL